MRGRGQSCRPERLRLCLVRRGLRTRPIPCGTREETAGRSRRPPCYTAAKPRREKFMRYQLRVAVLVAVLRFLAACRRPKPENVNGQARHRYASQHVPKAGNICRSGREAASRVFRCSVASPRAVPRMSTGSPPAISSALRCWDRCNPNRRRSASMGIAARCAITREPSNVPTVA